MVQMVFKTLHICKRDVVRAKGITFARSLRVRFGNKRLLPIMAVVAFAGCGSALTPPTLIPRPANGYQALRIDQQIDFPDGSDWIPQRLEAGTVLIGDRVRNGELRYCGFAAGLFGPVFVCAVKRGQEIIFLAGVSEYELRVPVPPGAIEEIRSQ